MRVIKTSSSAGADALAMAAVKAGLAPPALKAARLWLAEQLVAYEYAKLGQGGHTNTQVPLRRVFVDLPVTASQSAMPQHEDRPLFLAQLLTSAPLDLRIAFSRRVDNSSPGPSSEDVAAEGEVFEPGNVRRHRHSGWGATLLIGGPGQGKSTLGQLACQLHRAALIKPHEQELPSSQRDLVRSFVPVDLAQKDRRKQPPLGLPKSPFLPLQIALPELAAWFARQELRTGSDEAPALLRFLADLPSAKMFALGAQDLFALASNMPSLLVLDGFDEVGATQDRETIVSAARELLTALARRSASSQIVATTRPQGYADELAQIGIRFEKRYLAPLQRAEALEYARKLVEAKIPGVDQRQKALAQIHEAASEPATERLLTTPLQVTILTALVQQQGRVPRERWNLFSRYFAYMYDREIEHGTSASALLAQHRTHIERIHARVALLLQVEAERGGGASARMTRVRFAEVIEAVLSEDEVSESERTYLVGAIASAAENRLVFLVEPEPGKFGFDIRSLQEFMAATALTSGRDTEVEARLLQIAKAPMFRNVALFVASRLFSEGSPLRDVLADRVCGSLDEDLNDEFGRISRAGAMLALETLEEGAVLSQPKRARALMARAVGLLSLPAGSEHVRLARAATADTISVLRESIERYLSALETAHLGTAAWVCLVDAANRAEPWAVELGDKLWPPQFASRLLFQALGRVRVPLGPWLANKIEGSAETISPEEFIDMPAPLVEPGVPSNWVSWLVNVYGYRGHWRRRQTSGLVGLVSVRDTDDHMQVPSTRAPAHATWTAWINAARYELNPNASSLAAALEKVADLPTSQWINLQWRCSWPLVSCLTAANIPSDLKRYASELLLKNLGDTEAWLSAEHTWKDAIDLPAVLTDISESVPWNLESIKRAPPFLAVPAWAFIERASSRTRKPPASAVLKQANAAFHASRSQSLRERLADICLILWKGLSAKAARDAPSATDWVKASSIGASVLVPRPKFLSRNDWLDLLNASRGERIQPWIASGAAYFDALVEEPAHPVLLRLATMSVGLYSEHFPLGEEIKSSQVKTYAEALTSQTATSVSARADLATLQVFLGAVSTEREADVVRSVSDAAADDQGAWSRLMSALDVSRLPRPRIQALLLRIYAEIRPDDAATHAAVKQIRDALQKRTSDLDSQATWNRLALPLPYPQQPLQARLEGGIPARPVRIESMELNDIGGIQDLILPFKPPGDGQGQWVVILGPNGVGKTTLLRSLALALRSVKHPGIWPRGAFASSWQRVLTVDEAPANVESSIVVRLGDGVEHRTLIRPGGSISITQLPEQDRPRLFPLFAYGCRRGSALGGAARQVNLNDDDGPEIATLFDDGADLIQAETWLVSLEGDTSKNPTSKAIFDSVIEALKNLLDVDSVSVADQALWVAERGRPMLPFSSLSDGYLTSAGWFLDLVARWLKLAERMNHVIDANFLISMRGLVLIDEIDLHLHPRWQIEIISRTRRLLPEMSFIVTTHNPLTLVGAKAQEIWILSRQDGRTNATSGIETPMLLTGGQIYRRYFEIDDIYPDGLGRLLQRYSYLSGYALRDEHEQVELESIQNQLRKAGVDPGWEVVPPTSTGPEPIALPKAPAAKRRRRLQ